MNEPREIFLWTKADLLKARQVFRLIPNDRCFLSKFPALLSPEQASFVRMNFPKDFHLLSDSPSGFISEFTHLKALTHQLIVKRDQKIKKTKKFQASQHHEAHNSCVEKPIDPEQYICIFVTKPKVPSLLPKGNSIISEELPLSLKQRAFNHLTLKGFQLTDASKFGGDFLVYCPESDPSSSKSHSKWIAIVSSQKQQKLSQISFVRHARLGNFTGKRLMIIFEEEEEGNLVFLEYSFAFA